MMIQILACGCFCLCAYTGYYWGCEQALNCVDDPTRVVGEIQCAGSVIGSFFSGWLLWKTC